MKIEKEEWENDSDNALDEYYHSSESDAHDCNDPYW